ncbi:MAG: nucleoside hydrolase [Candidatus Limnocylindrales bacterium]
MIRLLIDTDTASDDAVALVLALRTPGVSVEAITVVAGNVPRDQGVQNALYTVELCGSRVPVYAGMAKPLVRPLRTAQDVHGQDGMGDIGLPVRARIAAPGNAVDVLLRAVDAEPGVFTLVTLGPLTNVAMAILRDPGFAAKVARCVTMGGTGVLPGNVTPLAEYNVWVDPEAAQIVFESGIPLTMVGWDISRQYATVGPDEMRRMESADSPVARFCVAIQRRLLDYCLTQTKLGGFDLPDPMAVAVALDPSVATHIERRFVAVETGGVWGCGQTMVDELGVTGNAPNVDLVRAADHQRFMEMLYRATGA